MARLPPVLAHYMPWFQYDATRRKAGWHWTMDCVDPFGAQPQVASHAMPLRGPYDSRDRAVIRHHLDLMRTSGICGLILNWYGTRKANDYPALLEASDIIVEEAVGAGMLFTVCYEDWTTAPKMEWGKRPAGELLEQATEQFHKDFLYIRDRYMGLPGFLRDGDGGRSGRPVVLCFGPRCLLDADDWAGMVAAVFAEGDKPIVFTLHGKWGQGHRFAWFPPLKPEGVSLEGVHQYLAKFYDTESKAGRPTIGVAWPGFRDFYSEGTGGRMKGHGVLPDHGGHTLEAAIDRAKRHSPLFLQLATWNDWGEGTQFEPSEAMGCRYLQKVRFHVLGEADDGPLRDACRAHQQEVQRA